MYFHRNHYEMFITLVYLILDLKKIQMWKTV